MKAKFTEGQKVFCILNGDGIVECTQGETVGVMFWSGYALYTDTGYSLDVGSEMRLLYPCRPKILAIPQDTKVWVWNEGERASVGKIGAHFSHFTEDGKPVVFGGGQTSWTHTSTTEYDYYEVVK